MPLQEYDASATDRVACPHLILIAGAAGACKTALIANLVSRAGDVRVGSFQSLPDISEPPLKALERHPFEFLLVELGAAESPGGVGQEEVEGAAAAPCATVITVVDAAALLPDFCSQELVRDRHPEAAPGDTRAIADVLTDQIEAADIMVLDNLADIGKDEVRGHIALLTALNPDALIVESAHDPIAPDVVFGRARQQGSGARRAAGWQRALAQEPFPDEHALRIASLVYRERRPFHPLRLHQLFGDPWTGVVRSRGVFWLASRPDWVVELSQAGASRRYRALSQWWVATLEGRTYAMSEVAEFLGVDWDTRYGDRRQELAFVGIGLDVDALRRRLDACLLTEAELALGPQQWLSFHDPFPVWSEPGKPVVPVTRR